MKTNFRFSAPAAKTAFLDEAATELADILKKPLPAIMVMLDDCSMYMNSETGLPPMM